MTKEIEEEVVIETIKYPAFNNNDVSTSVSPTENTDSDQQIDEKSPVELQTHEILYQNPKYKNLIRNENKDAYESLSQHSRTPKSFFMRYQPSNKKYT